MEFTPPDHQRIEKKCVPMAGRTSEMYPASAKTQFKDNDRADGSRLR
jgi:hypothetical protein